MFTNVSQRNERKNVVNILLTFVAFISGGGGGGG